MKIFYQKINPRQSTKLSGWILQSDRFLVELFENNTDVINTYTSWKDTATHGEIFDLRDCQIMCVEEGMKFTLYPTKMENPTQNKSLAELLREGLNQKDPTEELKNVIQSKIKEQKDRQETADRVEKDRFVNTLLADFKEHVGEDLFSKLLPHIKTVDNIDKNSRVYLDIPGYWPIHLSRSYYTIGRTIKEGLSFYYRYTEKYNHKTASWFFFTKRVETTEPWWSDAYIDFFKVFADAEKK